MGHMREKRRRPVLETERLGETVMQKPAGGGGLAEAVLRLQRTVGNEATTAVLQRRAEPAQRPGPPGAPKVYEETAPRVDLRFAKTPEIVNPRLRRGDNLHAFFSLVNHGDGPTTKADEIIVVPSYARSIQGRHEQIKQLGDRPIVPHGGERKYHSKFRGLRIHGADWVLHFVIHHAGKPVQHEKIPFEVVPP